jgi:hypothetical protein
MSRLLFWDVIPYDLVQRYKHTNCPCSIVPQISLWHNQFPLSIRRVRLITDTIYLIIIFKLMDIRIYFNKLLSKNVFLLLSHRNKWNTCNATIFMKLAPETPLSTKHSYLETMQSKTAQLYPMSNCGHRFSISCKIYALGHLSFQFSAVGRESFRYVGTDSPQDYMPLRSVASQPPSLFATHFFNPQFVCGFERDKAWNHFVCDTAS